MFYAFSSFIFLLPCQIVNHQRRLASGLKRRLQVQQVQKYTLQKRGLLAALRRILGDLVSSGWYLGCSLLINVNHSKGQVELFRAFARLRTYESLFPSAFIHFVRPTTIIT